MKLLILMMMNLVVALWAVNANLSEEILDLLAIALGISVFMECALAYSYIKEAWLLTHDQRYYYNYREERKHLR